MAERAESKDDPQERAKLLNKATTHYAKALSYRPDLPEILNNWGLMLAEEARRLSGKAAIALFQKAYEKYEQASIVAPQNRRSYENWGIALMDESDQLDGLDKTERLAEAEAKFRKSREISGLPNYNLVCIFAMREQTKDALDELEKCIAESVAPSKMMIEGDGDLASI